MVKAVLGHYDGKQIVLDEPVPSGIQADTRVRVLFDVQPEKHVLARIADLAISTDEFPPDFSEQHDHYVKGTPRK